jgi:hypothetical protein
MVQAMVAGMGSHQLIYESHLSTMFSHQMEHAHTLHSMTLISLDA